MLLEIRGAHFNSECTISAGYTLRIGPAQGPVPAMKPRKPPLRGTSQDDRRKNNLNVRWAQVLRTEIQVFYVTADDTSSVIADVLLRRNQSQRSCFAVIG